MTESGRLFVNVAAGYGRSLVALACGLFTGRWILMALGQTDYGLYGVVGGLTVFIDFFNMLLADAVARFYAVAVGRAGRDPVAGLEDCRRWFSVALTLHLLLPVALMAVGYPLGDWVVRAWLDVPPDRVEACRWVFRCLCVSCFVGMANAPFRAMFVAKQRLAELNLYYFLQTLANFAFVLWMVTRPAGSGPWLVPFAAWVMAIRLGPDLTIVARAALAFPECRPRLRWLWDAARVRALCAFAGWNLFGALGWLLRLQGMAVLVNRLFGPVANAGLSVANTVSFHCGNLATALTAAFTPAIANARGAEDLAHMRELAYRTSKLAPLLALLFLLPLALELPYALRLWLAEPPPDAVGLAYCVFAATLLERLTAGHLIAVNANGRIARYQAATGGAAILTIPLAALLGALAHDVLAAGVALAIGSAASALAGVWLARGLVGMGARRWLWRIVLPLLGISLAAAAVGALPHLWMAPSFTRLCLTTLLTETAFLPLSWLLLTPDERAYLLTKLRLLASKVHPRNPKGSEAKP